MAPLTGNQSVQGTSLKNALLMAQKEHPSDIKFIFEDGQRQASATLLATRKLISLDKVDVIISCYTEDTLIIAPVAQKAGVLELSHCWDVGLVERNSLAFSNGVSYKSYSAATIDLLKTQGFKHIAIAYNAGWASGTDYFKSQLQKADLQLVADECFVSDTTDYRTAALRYREAKPDVVVVLMDYPCCELFIRQFHQIAPQITVTGYLDLIQDMPVIEGDVYVTDTARLADNNFYNRYSALYHDSAEQTVAPYAYDTYQLLKSVNDALPKWNTQAAAQMLMQIKDFPGVTGSISCGPNRVFSVPVNFFKIVKGEKVYVSLQEIRRFK